jgi:hypothetical protein
MATAARAVTGLLLAVLLFAAGATLLHVGLYGLTIFAVFPYWVHSPHGYFVQQQKRMPLVWAGSRLGQSHIVYRYSVWKV